LNSSSNDTWKPTQQPGAASSSLPQQSQNLPAGVQMLARQKHDGLDGAQKLGATGSTVLGFRGLQQTNCMQAAYHATPFTFCLLLEFN
jgi:hypothetical protein